MNDMTVQAFSGISSTACMLTPQPIATPPMVQFDPASAAPCGISESPVSAMLQTTIGQAEGDMVIARALAVLEGRMRRSTDRFATLSDARNYCRLHLGGLDHEVFGILFLDAQNNLIELLYTATYVIDF